jgi:hypothetical protein
VLTSSAGAVRFSASAARSASFNVP